MNAPYKVVIVDDEMISRGYMELFIKPSRRYEIAASLPFVADALAWCRENTPSDLVILDVMMASGVDGLTAAGEIKRRYLRVKVIVTTSMADTDWLEKAREAGVESFWFKTYSSMSLLEVMDRTMAGAHVWPEHPPEAMLGTARSSEFTDRELEVLRYLSKGLSDKEIAERLHMGFTTVRYHIDNLMEKTGHTSRTALAVSAVLSGITFPGIDK